MPNITIQYFTTLFPEFTSTDQSYIETYIEIASMRVPPKVWGDRTKYATALLAAHMLTASGIGGLGSTGGAINSESVGSLNRSYSTIGSADTGDGEITTTRYGIDYLALRRETVIGATVTGRSPVPLSDIPDNINEIVSQISSNVEQVLVRALNSLVNPAYDQLDDYVSNSQAYHGDAAPGTSDAAPLWRIKKIVVTSGSAITTWADGNANFDKIWANRASYTYS